MNLRISFNKTLAIFATTMIALVAMFAFAITANAAVTGVTVTAPTAGDAWNGTQNITWNCTDDGVSPTCADVSLDSISYSPDGGTTWEAVGYTSGPFANVGTFSWNTLTGNAGGPNTESLNGKIRVILNSAGINNTTGVFTLDNTSETITSVTTNDTDGNGKIDEIAVLFSDSMDSSITDTTGITFGTYTLGANGTWSTTTNTNDTLTIGVTENSSTCDYSDQTGCDTDDVSAVSYTPGVLADLAGNLATAYAATPATDGAKPVIVGSKTDDTDNNGQIDRIYVQFSEDMDGSTVAAGDFSPNGYTPVITAATLADFVTLTIPEKITPDTDATPLFGISGGGASVKDLVGNELTNGDPGYSDTPTDGAAPVAIKAAYFNDPSDNSSVDRFSITFSEDISTTAQGSTGNIGNGPISVTNNGLTGFFGAPAYSIGGAGDGDNEVSFYDPTAGTTNLTGINGSALGEPTWSYTYNTTDTLQDAAGNLWEYIAPGATTMVDEAIPVVIDDLSRDTDSDGEIDTIELQFSEYVDDSTISAAAAADWGFSIDGGTTFTSTTGVGGGFYTGVNVIAGGNDFDADDDYIKFHLDPLAGTGVLDYKYTNDNTPTDDITDQHGNVLADISTTSATDGAAPQIDSITYLDQDGDGKIDAMKAYFTETVDSASVLGANDLTFNNVGDFTGAVFGADATDLITANVSDVIIPLGTEATVEDTRDDSVTLDILTQNAFSITDGTNVNANLGTLYNTTTYGDEAAPVLLTAHADTKTVGDGNGNTATMALKYTEDVSANTSTTASDYTVKVAISTNQITVSSVAITNDLVTLSLDASDADQTTAPMNITYALGTVEDVVNNQAVALTTTSIADKANPVLIGFTAAQNPAGIGDNLGFTLKFSEDMVGTTPLTGTTFDVVGSGAPGPYTINAGTISYAGDTWTADATDSPVVVGTPESGTHTFGAPVAGGIDPAGNAMTILSTLDLTFVVDSQYPETTGLEATPAVTPLGTPVVVNATVNDESAVGGADLYIEVGGSAVSLGAMTESQSSNGGKTKTYTKTIVMGAISGVSAGETYNIYVLGKDATGNIEQVDANGDGINDVLTETITTNSDTTAPTLTLDGDGSTVNIDADTYVVSGNVTPGDFSVVKVFKMVGATPSGANDIEVGLFAFGPSESHWEVLVNLDQNATSKFYAEAFDIAGNGTASGILTIVEADAPTDTTAPPTPVITTASIVTPASIDADDYKIAGTAGADTPIDGPRMVSIKKGTETVGTVILQAGETTWSVVVSLDQDTTNTFTAVSSDASNNTSAASASVTITEATAPTDTQAPATPVINTADATVDADSYNIEGTAGADLPTDGARIITVSRTVGATTAVVGSIVLPTGVTDWAFVAPIKQGVANTFTAISTDAASNSSAISNVVVITEDSTPGDTTPPVISSVSTDKAEYRKTQDTNVTVTIVEDDTANTVTVNGSAATETATPGTWTYTFAHAGNEGTFSLAVVATDAVGNQGTSDISYNVVADDAPDTQAPTVISTTPSAGAVSVSVTAGNATVQYNENIVIATQANIKIEKVSDGSSVKNGNATVVGDTLTIPYNALEYGTSYKITVMAGAVTDTATTPNNAPLTEVYFTTQSANAPGITAFSATNVMADSATINWATDVSVDTAEYRYSTSLYGGIWSTMTAGASGSQGLTGLTANTNYYYQVRFTKNGVTSESQIAQFTTAVSNTGLSVDSIQAVKSYATADDTYANGWKWRFDVTLNDLTETNLAMKFDQWVSGTNVLDAANNMRYSVDDATWTTITANGAYPATDINVSAIDNDVSKGGRQVTVYVEMKVPTGTTGGSYSTSYGVRAQ